MSLLKTFLHKDTLAVKVGIFSKTDFIDATASGQLGKTDKSIVAIKCSKKPKHDCIDITGRFAPSVYERLNATEPLSMEHYHKARNV